MTNFNQQKEMQLIATHCEKDVTFPFDLDISTYSPINNLTSAKILN